MDNSHYRPVSHPMDIGSKEYAVLDPEVAKERASAHLVQAQELKSRIESKTAKDNDTDAMTQQFLIACDYGCSTSPFILAHIILEQKIPVAFTQEDAVLFLKIAAERHHSKACLQMADCYAGKQNYQHILQAGDEYFSGISDKDRKFLAEYYFEQAQKFAAVD